MAYAIGLISGTSLDGCDAALVHIANRQAELIAFLTLPMSAALRARIMDCCSLDRSNIALTCSVNAELGYWFSEAAEAVCEQAGISLEEVACIGSHGQTVYHIPVSNVGLAASTLQLGEPAIIAYKTRRPVVSSFRAMDMAAGGRGAPLVPFAEYMLYRTDYDRALQNLGGIGNVTGLPANCALDDVFAFDTGPANMIIDELAACFFGVPFDDKGAIAASGQVNETVLAEWMGISFVTDPPPKATGRELYGKQFVDAAICTYPDIAPADWLATATRYTAETIRINYAQYVFPRCDAREIILSGGGAHNLTLRRMLVELFPTRTILTQEDIGFCSDAKEAVAFALIAYETLQGRPGNVPSATGARRPVILGSITQAPW